MSNYNQTTYQNLKKELEDTIKKIINYETRPLPNDPTQREERIGEYTRELVLSYNNWITYVRGYHDKLTLESKNNVNQKISDLKSRLLRALVVLDLVLDLPNGKENIDINKIQKSSSSKEEVVHSEIFVSSSQSKQSNSISKETLTSTGSDSTVQSGSQNLSNQTEPIHETPQNLPEQTKTIQETPQINLNFNIPEQTVQTIAQNHVNPVAIENMTMEKGQFLSLMAANIRKNYTGDPLMLTPFLASVDLMKEMADENPNLLTLLKKFVLTKLEGYASEIVPSEPESIEVIVKTLKEKIKPESSKVIEGRMMALRADRGSLQDYAQKAEELADSLRRALVMDGIPLAKAEEMTIDKTVELCRSNAQNQTVKSVLASTKFENPKEVIAKYVVESNTTKREAQVLAMRRFDRSLNFNRGGNTSNFNRNGRNNNFDRRFANNRGTYNNFTRDQNTNNNYRRGNFRRSEGNTGRQNNGGRQNHHNPRNVRRMENATAPQRTLGEAEEE